MLANGIHVISYKIKFLFRRPITMDKPACFYGYSLRKHGKWASRILMETPGKFYEEIR